MAIGPPHCGQVQGGRELCRAGVATGGLRFGSCGQLREAQRQQFGAPSVGKEPEVPDPDEAARQHVQKEPPQKLIQRQTVQVRRCTRFLEAGETRGWRHNQTARNRTS